MQNIHIEDTPEHAVSHNAAIRKHMLIDAGTVPHLVQLAEARFPPGECAPAHRHDDLYEVFMVQQGSGRMEVEGQPLPLSPGSCVTVAPGEAHSITNTSQETLVLRYFSIQR